jgi:hypothetical protein
MKSLIAVVFASLGAFSVAHAQGLLSIGPVFDDGQTIPLTGSYHSSIGWDSNPQGGRDSGQGAQSGENEGSGFWENGISLTTSRGKPESRLMFDGSYSNTWYLDVPEGADEFAHNGRLGLSYSRQFTRQLTVSNSFYASYQTEPDFEVGTTVNRRTGGSFFLNDSLSGTYAWTHRLSTVTGYTFSSVTYDDDGEVRTDESFESEDYVSNGLSQQFRYVLDRKTTGTTSYRFNQINYTGDSEGDSRSHFFLLGADRFWNRAFSMSANAGVQYREYLETGDGEAAPYGEAALTYRHGALTSVRWHHRFGLDDTDNAARAGQQGEEGGYSYRTGLSLNHQFSRRLSLNASVNYVYQTFPAEFDGAGDEVEQTVDGQIGLNYQWRRRVGVGFNYSYTTVISDDPFQEYDRHSISLGVTIRL